MTGLLAVATALAAQAATGATISEQIEKHAREALVEQAARLGLTDAEFELTVLPPSAGAQSCTRAVEIETLDLLHPSRMRFRVHCAAPLWSTEYIVRGSVSARVAVAAVTIEANRPIAAEDIRLERRTLSSLDRALSDRGAVVGKASRRSLRVGSLVERSALVEAVLIRRGASINIIARSEGIVATMPGIALASGRRGEVIAVRNSSSGKQIRCRVIGVDEVEAVTGVTSQSPD